LLDGLRKGDLRAVVGDLTLPAADRWRVGGGQVVRMTGPLLIN